MAVDQVSARAVQAMNSAGAQEAGLREGATLDGRVLAVNSDGTLRVATRYGQLDADPSQVKIAGGGHGHAKPDNLNDLIGKTVRLEVTGQNAASGRYTVKLVASEDLAAASAPDQSASADAEIAARIAADVSQAAAQQDGLAPVFADARLLANSSAVPPSVQTALAALGALSLVADGTISTQDILNALSTSGLFLEAKLARLAAGLSSNGGFTLNPALPLASQDLKAALFALKAALDSWIAAEAPAEITDPALTGTTGEPASQMAVSSEVSTEAAASAAAPTASFDTEALFAVLRPPPVVTPAAGQPGAAMMQLTAGLATPAAAQLAGLADRPDLSTLAALGEWLQAAGQVSTNMNGRRMAYGGRPSVVDGSKRDLSASDTTAPARPPPPRRGSLPQGQAAVSATAANRKPIDIARELAAKTSNALARVSLGQYASLPEEMTAPSAAGTNHNGQATKMPASWLFEIPLRIGAATSIAQFEIDQVFDGVPDTPDYRRAWRVQFSLDIAPMGPMHARLLLAGRRLSVGLWAEDRNGAAAIQRNILLLRQSLEAAAFTIDEIHFASGRPPSGPPVRAGGFIDRNA